MYTLSFPSEHHWTITAENEQTSWLETFAALLTLPSKRIPNSSRVMISSLLPEDPFRTPDWKVFGSTMGKIALNQRERLIEVGIPDEAQKKPESLSWGVKTVLVSITTLMLPEGCLLLHAATLVFEGQAVLIVAPSGGGKSTSARRVPPPWSAPGDENCLVIPNKKGGYVVSVLPTASTIAAGETSLAWDPSISYPLQAICILKQENADVIERYPQSEAAVCLTDSFRQAVWNQIAVMDQSFSREIKMQSFHNACSIAKVVPVYLLKATLTGRFWDGIQSAIFSPE